MTKLELSRFIKDLECQYSKFVADKFSKALSYGICDLECLEQKAFLVKETIKTLQRFYDDGKNCEDTCDLEIGSWTITNICGYINAPYTTYECYHTYSAATTPQTFVNSVWTFDAGSLNVTKQPQTVSAGTYTYDETTGILILVLANFVSPQTLTFSDDCSELTMEYDDPVSDRTVIVTLEATEVQSQDCVWVENTITEEEALDMYKKAKQLIGTGCGC